MDHSRSVAGWFGVQCEDCPESSVYNCYVTKSCWKVVLFCISGFFFLTIAFLFAFFFCQLKDLEHMYEKLKKSTISRFCLPCKLISKIYNKFKKKFGHFKVFQFLCIWPCKVLHKLLTLTVKIGTPLCSCFCKCVCSCRDSILKLKPCRNLQASAKELKEKKGILGLLGILFIPCRSCFGFMQKGFGYIQAKRAGNTKIVKEAGTNGAPEVDHDVAEKHKNVETDEEHNPLAVVDENVRDGDAHEEEKTQAKTTLEHAYHEEERVQHAVHEEERVQHAVHEEERIQHVDVNNVHKGKESVQSEAVDSGRFSKFGHKADNAKQEDEHAPSTTSTPTVMSHGKRKNHHLEVPITGRRQHPRPQLHTSSQAASGMPSLDRLQGQNSLPSQAASGIPSSDRSQGHDAVHRRPINANPAVYQSPLASPPPFANAYQYQNLQFQNMLPPLSMIPQQGLQSPTKQYDPQPWNAQQLPPSQPKNVYPNQYTPYRNDIIHTNPAYTNPPNMGMGFQQEQPQVNYDPNQPFPRAHTQQNAPVVNASTDNRITMPFGGGVLQSNATPNYIHEPSSPDVVFGNYWKL